uniref:ZP domain-containing protein n=1 Tax=Heterorhabditis bacteriophora TaxID=37862 RepID=A0A1I7XDZ2_HETBA
MMINGQRMGCVELLNSVCKRVKPKYHVFSHIHEERPNNIRHSCPPTHEAILSAECKEDNEEISQNGQEIVVRTRFECSSFFDKVVPFTIFFNPFPIRLHECAFTRKQKTTAGQVARLDLLHAGSEITANHLRNGIIACCQSFVFLSLCDSMRCISLLLLWAAFVGARDTGSERPAINLSAAVNTV